MFIKFKEHYHDTVHQINVTYSLPITDITGLTLSSATVGDETYYWGLIRPGVYADNWQFQKAQGPGTLFFPQDLDTAYTRMDLGDPTAGCYFCILSSNASAVRDFRVNGTQLASYSASGLGGDCLGFYLLKANGIEGIIIASSSTAEDNRIYSGFWMSLNFWKEGRVRQYDNNQPQTTAGDSDGSGGIGNGLPEPADTPASDTHTWVTTPLGHGINAWAVGEVAVGQLMDFLWGRGSSNAFDAGGLWQKWLNYKFNPIGAIISLHKLPDELTLSGTLTNISLAGFTFDGSASVASTTIQGNSIGSGLSTAFQYYESDTLKLPYSSYKDFARTSVELYVPYCGTMQIDPSVCIGGTISLTYQCDNITGALAVQVGATNHWGQYQTIGVMTGNCAYKVPLTGNDNGVGAGIQALSNIVIGSTPAMLAGAVSAGAQFAGLQHHTQISGDIRGNVGILAHQTAFVQITYGRYLDTVGNYNDNLGRPSYCSAAVKEFTGFSQLIVHADAVDIATDAERQEIEQICREGIYV